MKDKGFWYSCTIREAFGLSIAIVYTPEDRTVQISGMVGWMMLALGYTF